MKKIIEKNFSVLLLAIAVIFIFCWGLSAAEKNACNLNLAARHPIMRPDEATLKQWIKDYVRSPQARIDGSKYVLFASRGSLSLLSHISYVTADRDQGQCGNCWAWAGTGCMEVALDVQESIKNRLSVQYINSCETQTIGKDRCDGGWLSDVASFYSDTGKAVPWSNTNANWTDGNLSYHTSCAMVATTPNYSVSSAEAQTITTTGVAQATAIANIKNILNQNKSVWFGFFLPNQTAWNSFYDFWDDQSESAVYDIDQFIGQTYNYNTGGGHAVLCVGYNDTDPNNSYWIMLNSWGAASGRSNGLFRINMDMNYGGTNPGSGYAFYFQSLDIQYNTGPGPVLSSFSMTDRTSGSSEYTKERTVNVAVSGSGSPAQIGFSSNADFSSATWKTYSASTTYELPASDGAKTIYCRLKNSGGTESNTRNASIYLDTTPPSVDFQLNNHDLKTGDYINDKPALRAVITETVGVVESSLKINRDGTQINDGASGSGRYDSYDTATKTLTYTFKNPLTSGSHILTFQVSDLAGNTTTLTYLDLNISGTLALEDVMNYPNPFGTSTYFSYQLSKDAEIIIKIYTTRGELVKTLTASAGSTGGQLGFNKISWSGSDESEKPLPNGLYLYLVTASDSSGRITRKSKAGIAR